MLMLLGKWDILYKWAFQITKRILLIGKTTKKTRSILLKFILNYTIWKSIHLDALGFFVYVCGGGFIFRFDLTGNRLLLIRSCNVSQDGLWWMTLTFWVPRGPMGSQEASLPTCRPQSHSWPLSHLTPRPLNHSIFGLCSGFLISVLRPAPRPSPCSAPLWLVSVSSSHACFQNAFSTAPVTELKCTFIHVTPLVQNLWMTYSQCSGNSNQLIMPTPRPCLRSVWHTSFVSDKAQNLHFQEPLIIPRRGHSPGAANTLPLGDSMLSFTHLPCLESLPLPRSQQQAHVSAPLPARWESAHCRSPSLVTQIKGMTAALTMALSHPGASLPATSGRWGPWDRPMVPPSRAQPPHCWLEKSSELGLLPACPAGGQKSAVSRTL